MRMNPPDPEPVPHEVWIRFDNAPVSVAPPQGGRFVSVVNLVFCVECGAYVPVDRQITHAGWHDRLNALLAALAASPVDARQRPSVLYRELVSADDGGTDESAGQPAPEETPGGVLPVRDQD